MPRRRRRGLRPRRPLFQTQRQRVVSAYRDAKQPFSAGTKPYKSTLMLFFDVVDPHPVAAPTMAHAVCRRGQILEWFGYGLNDTIPSIFGNRRATESDTNLGKARSTNGAEDYVIEAVSATHKSTLIRYTTVVEAIVDNDVQAAYTSTGPNGALGVGIYDPAALLAPAQLVSPFNLEDPFWEAIKPLMQIEFEWDRKRVEKIGTLDEIPEGGAKSLLKASGDPRTDNRYKIPEGYIWRRDGQPDSEFIMRGTMQQSIVIPISLLTGLQGLTTTPRPIPAVIGIELTMRVHGMSVNIPTRN